MNDLIELINKEVIVTTGGVELSGVIVKVGDQFVYLQTEDFKQMMIHISTINTITFTQDIV